MIRDREPMERLLGETAWLRRLARSLVRGHDVAEDVVQETLLRAVAAPAATIGNLRGWLAAVAANVARRFRRDAVREQRRRQAMTWRDAEPSVAEAIARTEAQQCVMAALLAMAEPYRSVLLLRFQGGLGHAAIAAKLEVPVETVRTQIKRGLQRLRDQLDGRPGGRAAWSVAALGAMPRTAAILTASVAATAAATALVWAVPEPASSWDRVCDASVVAIESAGVARSSLPAAVAAVAREPAPLPSATTPVSVEAATELSVPLLAESLQFDRGRVLDAVTRLPVAGAEVRIVSPFVRITPAPPAPAVVFTGRDGWYEIEYTLGGSGRELTVSARGYTPQSVAWERVCLPPAGRDRAGRSDEAAPPANAATLADVLLEPAVLAEVVVLQADGRRAADAEVLVVSTALTNRWSETLGHCDASGVWQGVVPRRLGTRTFLVALYERAVGSVASTSDVRHVVRLGPVRDLHVRVVDDAGAAVEGAFLLAHPAHEWAADRLPCVVGGDLWGRSRRFGRTDARGHVTLRGVPLLLDGPACWLQASASGHRGEQRVQELPAADGWVQVVLPRGPTGLVHGRVVDAETGAPIARAMVGNAVTTGADGRFACPDTDLAQGRVRLDVAALGYVPLPVDEPVGGRVGAIEVDVALRRAERCRGRVVDERGLGIAGVHLAPLRGHGATTTVDGSFLLLDVPPGRVRLQLERSGTPDFLEPWAVEIDTSVQPCEIRVADRRER